jgi:ABC-2 type transport system ATP-binding protein
MLLGIIEPSSGSRLVLGHDKPIEMADQIGYLPEERGLYPSMHTREAIAFMGALRGLPLDIGRKRAEILLRENGLGDYVAKPIKSLSKGMAQTIQLFGTIVHRPKLIVLDEPFSGLDAINQGRLEHLIREEADPHSLKGHGADRPVAGHARPRAAADHPRRADQRPGPGRAA